MSTEQVVKVYQVNDIEWYAATSAEQAVQLLVTFVGEDEAHNQMEDGTYPILLSDDAMQAKRVVDIEGEFGPQDHSYTYAEYLKICLDRGFQAPFLFCCVAGL